MEVASKTDNNETLKFSILIIAAIILISLIVSAVLIYRCFTMQKKNVDEILEAQIKIHKLKK